MSLPDDWSSSQAIPIASTPLGRLNLLAMRDVTVSVPAAVVDATGPAEGLGMLDLRIRLLRDSTPRHVRDRAWRYVGEAAREHRGEWNLFALGVAYPGLRQRARKLTENVTTAWAAQVHFNLAAEFLLALHRLNLDTPNVISRLIGAAYDQASGRKRRLRPRLLDLDQINEADLPHSGSQAPPGDPRAVLTRLVHQSATAVNGHRLTDRHAALIAGTYLDGHHLYDVAADLHLSAANASKHRARAEVIIATLLGHPELARRTTRHAQANGDKAPGR